MNTFTKSKKSINNEFLNIINLPVLNTDNTIRYSLMYQVRPEKLSDHITDVSILSYLIAKKLIVNYDEDINIGLMLEKVLLHDLDEVLTGDIPRSTKYYSKEGLTAMRKVADDAMHKLSSEIEDDSIYKLWSESKSGKEGKIVDLADMICVARKVVKEYGLLGNVYFLKVAYEMVDNMSKVYNELDTWRENGMYSADSVEYLKQLVSDTKSLMTSMVNGDERYHKYGVDNNVFNNHNH